MSSFSTARDVMVRRPRTLPADTTIEQVHAELRDDHLHMILLTDGRHLVGTMTRSDLPEPSVSGPAVRWATLEGRTVGPETSVASIEQMLIERGRRRLAVVDAGGALLGLMCLKRHGRGFCTDDDVESRQVTASTPTAVGDELTSTCDTRRPAMDRRLRWMISPRRPPAHGRLAQGVQDARGVGPEVDLTIDDRKVQRHQLLSLVVDEGDTAHGRGGQQLETLGLGQHREVTIARR